MNSDWDILQHFVQAGSQQAFGELVSRYVDLVYSAARRQVRSAELAEDVTQAVFIILSRKAQEFRQNVILPAWLLRTTCYAANNAMRSEQRRQKHEREAGRMRPTDTISLQHDRQWEEISPMLDEAMDAMRQSDREVLVLRFFNRRKVREVGDLLGISEDAAKLRITRAIGRLGALLKSRGVSVGATALAAHVEASAVQIVPAHVSASLAANGLGSAGGASAGAMTIANGALAAMTIIRIKAAAVVILCLFAVMGAVVATSQLRGSSPPAAKAPAPASAPSITTMPTTQADAAADEPLATLMAISAGLHDTNLPAVRSCLLLGDNDDAKLFNAHAALQVERVRLESALQRAGIPHFDVSYGSPPMEMVIDLVSMQLNPDDVQISGDSAVIHFRVPRLLLGDESWEVGQLLFTRVNGKWRLNIRDGVVVKASVNIMDANRRMQQITGPEATKLLLKVHTDIVGVYARFTADVAAGRFANAAECQRAFTRRTRAVEQQFHIVGSRVDMLPKQWPTTAVAR